MQFHRRLPKRTALLFLAFILTLGPHPWADAEDSQPTLWWKDALQRAEAGGYRLMALPELLGLFKTGGPGWVLLDVRPDYEYRDGHLPGAVNLEFHLGHKNGLEPERAESLKTLLGPEKGRLIVIYCRNFR